MRRRFKAALEAARRFRLAELLSVTANEVRCTRPGLRCARSEGSSGRSYDRDEELVLMAWNISKLHTIGRPRRHFSLGRCHGVVRRTWLPDQFPSEAPANVELFATGRTAAGAADLARQCAKGFQTSGYDKRNRAWWAIDGGNYYDFSVISVGRKPHLLAVTAAGALLLAAIARACVFSSSRRPQRALQD